MTDTSSADLAIVVLKGATINGRKFVRDAQLEGRNLKVTAASGDGTRPASSV